MAEPLDLTFQALTTTANPFAGELLIAALDVPVERIQSEAVHSIVARSGVREHIEAIRRYPHFSPALRKQLESSAPSLVPALRQCLLWGRSEYDLPALELSRAGEAFGLIENLLSMLRSNRKELHEEVVGTLRHLVNRLYEHLYAPKEESQPPLKNATQIQHLATLALDQSLAFFHDLAHVEVIVESLFALTRPGDPIPQKLLTHPSKDCRSLAKDLLLSSRHPGVMRFVLDSLSRPNPPSRVIDVLQRRDDEEFILATLRWVPKRWTSTQERNLKQVERLPWLENGTDLLLIPEDLQTALVTLTCTAGLSREKKQEVREWVIRHGSPEARDVAIAVIEETGMEKVKEIVLDGLDSVDPSVQAWATGQLRNQHVPDALSKLIDQLDNPEACVQAVARQELQGFDLECLLARFEFLSPLALANASKLLQKIDPDCFVKLMHEFYHSIRRRRVRAIRGVQAYGWHLQVLPAILELLKDGDPIIRRTTVEVLADVHHPEVLASLVAMQGDPHPRVREAVDEALAKLAQDENAEACRGSLPARS